MATSPEEMAFIRDMEAHPGDAHPALVFADWLEENGKPAHAEMIRLHHADLPHQYGGMAPGGYRYKPQYDIPKHPNVRFFTEDWLDRQVGIPETFKRGKGDVLGRVALSFNLPKSGERLVFGKNLPEHQALALSGAINEEMPAGSQVEHNG